MGVYDFKKDLVEGHKAEEEVLKVIRRTYSKAYRVEGYFKYYDIVIPEINKSVEVKFDWAARNTGNYFIETEFNKKDEYGDIVSVESGILTTTANYWCEVDHELIVFIELETLKHLLQDYQIVVLPPKKTSLGVKGYLVPKNKLIFSPYAIVIDKSDKEKKLSL